MPKRTRSSIDGVVWRKLPSDLKVMTVFGKQTINVKTCECCGETKNVSEFYLESSSKRKYAGQVRDFCVVCWDENNGKTILKTQTANTLVSFIDSEKSHA